MRHTHADQMNVLWYPNIEKPPFSPKWILSTNFASHRAMATAIGIFLSQQNSEWANKKLKLFMLKI